MAKMIPISIEDDHGSVGERKVFESLREKLPKEYTVFHSIRWNSYNEKNTVVWGECDFTVFHPKYGMITLEVKSGGIEYINGKWSYIRTDNKQKYAMRRGPLEQVDRTIRYKFKDLVSDILEKSGCPEPQYCLVEPAVWFPSINKGDIVGELPMEYKDSIVLYENALEDPLKYIKEIYSYYGGEWHTRLSDSSSLNIINGFAPCFSAIPSLSSIREEKISAFVRLTNEQKYLLDYLEEQRVAAVQGAAGTGKTMLAVEKAKRLRKNGKVLFLCFNRYLKEYLQELKENHPEDYLDIEFYNLPQMVCSAMKVPTVDSEDVLFYLQNYRDYEWGYRHIVIDEGQDFSGKEIERLYRISIQQKGAFYVFYDKKQFVHGTEFPDWLANAECRLVLNINCRNTFQIADTSGRTVNIIPKVKNRSVNGDMPNFNICRDKKEALDVICRTIDRYRSAGYPYEQICILTLKKESTSFLKGVERIGNHRIQLNRNDSGVFFTSARKFKGLESDIIIIVDVDDTSLADDEGKMLFYVGSSRAKHQLEILFIGDDLMLNNTIKMISDKSFPNTRIGIARCLHVKPAVF